MGDGKANVTVSGVGWLDPQAWGLVRQRATGAYGDGRGLPPWKMSDLFGHPVKNMGRFNRATRMTISACALALRDAGRSPGGVTRDLGLIGTNVAGCVEDNEAYFRDYLEGGRTLARGNLFIYTLPSSPLAETAIHFGLTGPMLYVGFPGGGLKELLETAAGLLGDGKLGGMLAVRAEDEAAMGFLLERAEDPGGDFEAICDACASGSVGEPWSAVVLRLAKAWEGSGGK